MPTKNVFTTPGSPLSGMRVPQDWKLLDPQGKRRALVAYGYAQCYEAACRLMGRHQAAVVRARRELKARLEVECERSLRRSGEGRDL